MDDITFLWKQYITKFSPQLLQIYFISNHVSLQSLYVQNSAKNWDSSSIPQLRPSSRQLDILLSLHTWKLCLLRFLGARPYWSILIFTHPYIIKKKGRYFIQIFPAFSVNLQMQSNQCTFGIIQIEAHNPNPVWHMRFWSLDKQKLHSWTAPFLSHSWTSVLFMGFHYLINTISYMCRTSMKWLPLILYEQRKQPERDKQLVVWCCLPTNRDRKFKRTSIPWFLSNHVQGWKQNRRITSATNRFVIQSCLAMVHSWWLHYTVTKWIVKRSWLTKS